MYVNNTKQRIKCGIFLRSEVRAIISLCSLPLWEIGCVFPSDSSSSSSSKYIPSCTTDFNNQVQDAPLNWDTG